MIKTHCRFLLLIGCLWAASGSGYAAVSPRERILLNEGWRFFKYADSEKPDPLIYDTRPEVTDSKDDKPADSMPTEAEKALSSFGVLKPWIMPSGNEFLGKDRKPYLRPEGNPGEQFPFVQLAYDDSKWEQVTLPHDWAIRGPFYSGENVPVGGGMGRLPVQGTAWYRKELLIPAEDAGKQFYLEIDGAMSCAMVWINGKLAGGWPYGYSSWQVDLTPYIKTGSANQLAIRLDNPASSSRWYPGAGLYRSVWLTKTTRLHVVHWGTRMRTTRVTEQSAMLHFEVTVQNNSSATQQAVLQTKIYELDSVTGKPGKQVAAFKSVSICTDGMKKQTLSDSLVLKNPRLWGPVPSQRPFRYVAVTMLTAASKVLDRYETVFGIRDVRYDASKGLFVNGVKVVIQGVNQHHDLGALGAAFNSRAAERQLERLREMGCNAIRMSHNPPDPALLELTDKMGFLVIDEIFDCWQRKKTPLDFHLIFDDWSEQDLRAMIRRDFNHPSVIVWSFGNEVGEQYTDTAGVKVAKRLLEIIRQEDRSRPATLAMNYAKPDMPLPAVADLIGLNYQGEGIRYDGPYAGLKGISTPPLFPRFHEKYPDKMIISTENASALSSRGEYLFPVFSGNSSPIRDGQGGDSRIHQVSSYDLYSVEFGSSADKVFATLANHPYVAGGFAWTGWDYLGEPTPYYSSRSSYSGIIDLAGFKKDRFYLYQSQWRPDFPMAHLLPHWTWPGREGQITPVHVMTSGDEAELFLNDKSLGRKKKQPLEYRLRWDSVCYEPGQLRVISYKNGKTWAADTVMTAGSPAGFQLTADKSVLRADGSDLVFVTVRMTDSVQMTAPRANTLLTFSTSGSLEFVAADNGDATDLTAFPALSRRAYNGYCLVILRSIRNRPGSGTLTVHAEGMEDKIIKLRTCLDLIAQKGANKSWLDY